MEPLYIRHFRHHLTRLKRSQQRVHGGEGIMNVLHKLNSTILHTTHGGEGIMIRSIAQTKISIFVCSALYGAMNICTDQMIRSIAEIKYFFLCM